MVKNVINVLKNAAHLIRRMYIFPQYFILKRFILPKTRSVSGLIILRTALLQNRGGEITFLGGPDNFATTLL
jgi:hypothetical protein